MKVKKLIEILKEKNQEAEIVVDVDRLSFFSLEEISILEILDDVKLQFITGFSCRGSEFNQKFMECENIIRRKNIVVIRLGKEK